MFDRKMFFVAQYHLSIDMLPELKYGFYLQCVQPLPLYFYVVVCLYVWTTNNVPLLSECRECIAIAGKSAARNEPTLKALTVDALPRT